MTTRRMATRMVEEEGVNEEDTSQVEHVLQCGKSPQGVQNPQGDQVL